MKKRLTAGLLAVCLLTGLTGCSSDQLTEQVTDKLLSSDDGIAFAVDKPVKDDSMTLTVRSITLSDAVYAPLTTDSEGAYTAYYTEDGTGKEQDADKDSVYLDCTADIKNTGDQALDLEDDLFFYAITGGKVYGDYMAFTESDGGAKLADADTLDVGKTARVHYAIILPADVDANALDVAFMLPSAETVYRVAFPKLAVTDRSLPVGGAVKTNNGAMLTIESAKLVSSIDPVTSAGGDTSVQLMEGGNMVDVVLTIQNNSDTDLPLGTLFSGRMTMDSISRLGTPLLEADMDLQYTGSIPAGTSATAHLVFDADGMSVIYRRPIRITYMRTAYIIPLSLSNKAAKEPKVIDFRLFLYFLLQSHGFFECFQLGIHRRIRCALAVLFFQRLGLIDQFRVQRCHRIGFIKHPVRLVLHAVKRAHRAVCLISIGRDFIHALLRLGHGNRCFDGCAARFQRFNVTHELVVHLAHLDGIFMCRRVCRHQTGTRTLQLLFLCQKDLCIAFVARQQCLLGEIFIPCGFCLIFFHQPSGARLLCHDTGSFFFDLCKVFVKLAQVLVDHLGRIFHLIKHSIDICLYNVSKSRKNTHSFLLFRSKKLFFVLFLVFFRKIFRFVLIAEFVQRRLQNIFHLFIAAALFRARLSRQRYSRKTTTTTAAAITKTMITVGVCDLVTVIMRSPVFWNAVEKNSSSSMSLL